MPSTLKKGTVTMCLTSNVQSEPIINFYSTNTWALIISIFALTISIWQWVRTLWNERFAIKVKSTGYQLLTSESNSAYRSYIVGFIVDNLSSLPVSISYISFKSDKNEWVQFRLTKRFMKEHYIPPGLDKPYRFFTTDFPINIDAHSSALIYVIHESLDKTEILLHNNKANFRFRTSRGSKVFYLDCNKMSVLSQ